MMDQLCIKLRFPKLFTYACKYVSDTVLHFETHWLEIPWLLWSLFILTFYCLCSDPHFAVRAWYGQSHTALTWMHCDLRPWRYVIVLRSPSCILGHYRPAEMSCAFNFDLPFCDFLKWGFVWVILLKFGCIKRDALEQQLLNIRLKLQGRRMGKRCFTDDIGGRQKSGFLEECLTLSRQGDGDVTWDILHSLVIFPFSWRKKYRI